MLSAAIIYSFLQKQNTSLQKEVDRLEASLALLEDTRMTSSSQTDVRVVLYGDLVILLSSFDIFFVILTPLYCFMHFDFQGTALTEGLPAQNSVTESLFAVNVKLLERLDHEKKKVEEKNERHQEIVSQLEQLVATVRFLLCSTLNFSLDQIYFSGRLMLFKRDLENTWPNLAGRKIPTTLKIYTVIKPLQEVMCEMRSFGRISTLTDTSRWRTTKSPLM